MARNAFVRRRQTALVALGVAVLALTVLAGGTAGSERTAPAPVNSSFDAGADGWTIAGDAGSIEYVASGGTPGGYVCGDDDVSGDTWYFSAPTAFIGDRAAYYGGSLRFDLRQSSTTSQFDNHDVVIGNETATVVYDFGNASAHPGTDWTHYAVPLDASANWTTPAGATVSEADFRSIMRTLTRVRIRGEYVSGADRGCLDSVRMTSRAARPAAIRFADQRVSAEVDTQAVTVSEVDLPDGGYVVVYTSPRDPANPSGTVVGASSYYGAGQVENVRIALGESLNDDQDLLAVPHRDTDGDNVYEFGSGDDVDGPYRNHSGSIVSDRATVTVIRDTPVPTPPEFTPTSSPTPIETPTATPTPSPTPTATPTPTERPSPTSMAGSGETTADEGSGFGVIAALIGLVAAALFLSRR